jgi:hypothetical protein
MNGLSGVSVNCYSAGIVNTGRGFGGTRVVGEFPFCLWFHGFANRLSSCGLCSFFVILRADIEKCIVSQR